MTPIDYERLSTRLDQSPEPWWALAAWELHRRLDRHPLVPILSAMADVLRTGRDHETVTGGPSATFAVQRAALWLESGIEPEEAAGLIRGGIYTPDERVEVPRYRFSVSKAGEGKWAGVFVTGQAHGHGFRPLCAPSLPALVAEARVLLAPIGAELDIEVLHSEVVRDRLDLLDHLMDFIEYLADFHSAQHAGAVALMERLGYQAADIEWVLELYELRK